MSVFILAGLHDDTPNSRFFQGEIERNEIEFDNVNDHQPAEWQNRVYGWRSSPEIPSAALKSMIDFDHWTVSQHISSPQNSNFSALFDTVWLFLLRLLTPLLRLLQQAIQQENSETVRDGRREDSIRRLLLRKVPFFLLALPRVSLYGLPRDETHYEGVKDISSRQSLDALVRKRAGKGFLGEKFLSQVPDGFEVNTEIIFVPARGDIEGDVPADIIQSIRFWNFSPNSAVKSAQFDAFYPFNRKEFQQTQASFPERLLEGNLDNFLAIPGSGIPVDKDTFTNFVYSLRSGLAKSADVECVVDEPTHEALRTLKSCFNCSESDCLLDYLGIDGNGDDFGEETTLIRPQFDYLFDESNFGGQQWKLRRMAKDVWIPYADHFENVKNETPES